MKAYIDYKNLSKTEKIEVIQQMNFCRMERHDAAVYLKALWRNDKLVTDEYECFGDRPYQFFLNKRTYDKGMLFGFTDIAFDDYGWLTKQAFSERIEIKFVTQDRSVASNYISVGQGKNGKWTYAVSYSTGAAGSGYGLGVWGKVMDSKKQSLIAALQELLNGHRKSAEQMKNDTCGNFNAKFSREIVRQAKDMFDELTGRKAVQLSLF